MSYPSPRRDRSKSFRSPTVIDSREHTHPMVSLCRTLVALIRAYPCLTCQVSERCLCCPHLWQKITNTSSHSLLTSHM